MNTRTLALLQDNVREAKAAFASALASVEQDANKNEDWAGELDARGATDDVDGTPGLVCWWDQHPYHDESETGSVFFAAYVDLEDTLVCAFWHPATGEWEAA